MRRSANHLQLRSNIEPLESRRMLSADLVPQFTGRLPAVIAPSGVTHLNLNIRDAGVAAITETAAVRVYASVDGLLDGSDILLGTVQKSTRLRPGAAAHVRMNISVPGNLADGHYFLLAQVDDSSSVAVSKNTAEFVNAFSDVAVQFSKLPPQPIEIDGPSAGKRTVRANVINTGNVAVHGMASVNFYLSANATLDSTDALLATISNQRVALKPHASQPVSFRVAVPPGTAVGAYFLFATVTPGAGLIDSNAANNTAISTRRVAVVTQLPHPTRIERNNYYYDNGTYIYEGNWSIRG